MPTWRWMYIAPISLLCVAAELTIMFGFHWKAIGGVASAPETYDLSDNGSAARGNGGDEFLKA